MSHPGLAPVVLAATLIASLTWIAPADAGQGRPPAWTVTRTPDGQPDLQGTWLNNSITPLERPKALEGKSTLTDEEVAELKKRSAEIFDPSRDSDFAGGDNVFLALLANAERYRNPNSTGTSAEMVERTWDNRTSLIVDPPDGRIPVLTPDGQSRRAAAAALARRPPAGPEEISNANRCITFGMPRLGGNSASYNSYYQFVQTVAYVVIVGEVIHEARVIPIDGRPHLPQSVRLWHGDPRGRWEANTLVVETTNFSPKSDFMGSAEHLHLLERFTPVAPDVIEYHITLTDPTTWTKPWTAVIRLRRTQDQMFEYACHEGNHVIMEGMLLGARAQEKSATASAPR